MYRIIDKIPCISELRQVYNEVFIVGGFVRDFIALGKVSSDIDLCGDMTYDRFVDRLPMSYKVVRAIKKFGCVEFTDLSETFNFTYTTFRVDEYEGGGHSPKNIEFVYDADVDAKRRDFTVNAIYYNLKTNEYVDPIGGIEDIKLRQIRQINKDVLKFDGLRIVRMCRFASDLDFKIEENTRLCAMSNIGNLKAIAIDKIACEISKSKDADKTKMILKEFTGEVLI